MSAKRLVMTPRYRLRQERPKKGKGSYQRMSKQYLNANARGRQIGPDFVVASRG